MQSDGSEIRSDAMGRLGASIMFGFAMLAGWRWLQSGLLFFALLLIRDLIASWFLVARRSVRRRSSAAVIVAASYVSCGLPLFYSAPTKTSGGLLLVGSLLPVAGFALSTLALLDLGESFGVAPANRGRVQDGVYGYLAHPMYVGYGLAELGMVILNCANAPIFLFSIGFYWFRAREEGRVIRLT